MKKNISSILFAALAIITSCKKDPSPLTPVKTGDGKNTIDTLKMIQGLWKGNLSYYTLELKSDFSFIQDWTNVGIGYYKAKYKLHNDSLVVVDNSGNPVWLGDARIVKITPDSLVLTALGFTYRHVRFNPPVSPYGIMALAGGFGTSALYPFPVSLSPTKTITGITEDSKGAIYIADWSGGIYTVNPIDKKISAFLTQESLKTYEPYFVPVSIFIYPGSDDIYFASDFNVYKYSLKTKQLTNLFFQTVGAGNSILISGVTADKAGNVYVIDRVSNVVYKIDTKTKALIAITGQYTTDINLQPGTGTNAHLYPKQLAIDDANNMYIADARTSCIWKLDLNTNKIKIVAGNGSFAFSGDGGPAINASLCGVNGVAIDGKGCIYISDQANTRVRKVDENGNISTIAGRIYGLFQNSDDANTSTIDPEQIYVNQLGTEVLVVDAKRYEVQKLYLR